MRYWDLHDWIFAASITFVLGLFSATFFVYIPAGLSADAQCLEAGYPKSTVTWNLKKYCMNLQGTITVKVDAVQNVE